MDTVWVEAILSLGVGLGLAAAAGLRVFLPLLLLGAAARLGWVGLSEGFQWLESGWALGALASAAFVEIAAYHIPWVDHLLDVVAAPAAVVAGVLLTAAAATDLPPALRWAAAIVAGGGTAGAVQGLTSLARITSTATTGGLGNPLIATIEWIASLLASFVAIFLPALALAIVVGVVFLAARMGRRLLRKAPAAR
jgi:hypothetical protein